MIMATVVSIDISVSYHHIVLSTAFCHNQKNFPQYSHSTRVMGVPVMVFFWSSLDVKFCTLPPVYTVREKPEEKVLPRVRFLSPGISWGDIAHPNGLA
jgi:hypothetical protein